MNILAARQHHTVYVRSGTLLVLGRLLVSCLRSVRFFGTFSCISFLYP